ncbi:NUDIX domain-containing protein [Limoniibacter endophyticus]|uniref:DNA mismatch repair protein MutT n=1 Tax=Limoniibacter endophyticus TaxID=1565040 RepID=A0A8J3DKR2_9HYPH|nr:NUDIX domain-containing protein [Limoniibacter endophyticus]GHC65488.1 DNA mismatch repair protein MutT [Limoniibacter endophyticus]
MDLKRLRGRLFHLWFLLSRPMTLGVRVVVHDREKDALLLVRHTYVGGWHLPGGGVDPGETMVEAARREVLEETGLEIRALSLVSTHLNTAASRRDHVLVYLAHDFSGAPRAQQAEIAELGFFALTNLPTETTIATRRRIAEIFDGVPGSDHW